MNKPIYLSLSILGISKKVRYEFWYDYIKLSKQSKTMLHEYKVLSFILKLKMCMKTLLMMLKTDLTHQIMKSIYHYH